MDQPVISCPSCGTEIPLTEAISKQLETRLREEFQATQEAQEKRLSEREENLKTQKEALAEREKTLDAAVQKELEKEKVKIAQEASRTARENAEVELRDLKAQLEEKDQAVEILQNAELALRKEKREVERQRKEQELAMTRKLDAERDKLVSDAQSRFEEEHRLTVREKDKRIEEMLKQIETLKQKAQQGSQQTQGEVLELELEELLKQAFPHDEIAPVPTGLKGADVIQTVHIPTGVECGTILWECKRTRNWSSQWVEKLKDSQREIRAEAAAIVTCAMPPGTDSITRLSGVWVVSPLVAVSLARLLRDGLTQVALVQRSNVGRNEKMQAIYEYLSGTHFRQRVEGIVESFKALKEELEAEKRAMSRIWARREKQIERVITNTAGMYGDVQAIAGTAVREIPSLELGPPVLNDATGGDEETMEAGYNSEVQERDASSADNDEVDVLEILPEDE